MRQNEVQIGGEYRVKIGSRLAPVRVLHTLPGRGRRRFACLTQDTGREVKATAARLRPLVDPPRRPAAEAPVEPSPVPAPFEGCAGTVRFSVVPVPGLLPNPGNGTALQLSRANHAYVRRLVDREHVAEGMMRIARVVRHAIGRHVRWSTIPRDLRRGVLFTAACIHHANRERYTAVMGHAPLPSPRAVAEAVAMAVGLGREPL